jgi:NADPH:quinone reductase-like Zn-dependent oxidoreductase
MTDAAPTPVPSTCLELRSTVTEDGFVLVGLHETEVPVPGDDEVLVRVEAAPINPSDLGMLFAGADLATAEAVEDGGQPAVRAELPSAARRASAGRLGQAMPVGNEGGGTVVAAGASAAAQSLIGRTVGFLTGSSYAQYRTADVASCIAMTAGTDPVDAAAAFVNPLTALGMVETMRLEGHNALVHTVGASNLGRMLSRICHADGIGLVDVVRRPEHVELLRGDGVSHVVDSSAPTFRDDLLDALRATGATIAFDAIGGGELASILLWGMEQVASEGAAFSRYGSETPKQVYVYGNLDRRPTVLHRDFGMTWAVGGWLLRPFLRRVGAERADQLRRRVADEITTTFASSYGPRLALRDVVDPDRIQRYARMATGDKALVTPLA